MHGGKRVLDVGQCGPDHSSITHLLTEHFNTHVDRSHGAADTLEMIAASRYDLVLVNRLMDADGASGLDIIKQIQSDDEYRNVPVMLISNFADAQESAIQAGAVRGFGKNALRDAATVELLKPFLG